MENLARPLLVYLKIKIRTILSLSGDHNDAQQFDGPGGKLGHAFLPGTSKAGDIHMDAEEKWTETFLYNVAVHEIGHSLGLGHSWYDDSVMYSAYTRTTPITSLHQDDQDGVNRIYGKKQHR
jgi:predicted Zn-dependent protease